MTQKHEGPRHSSTADTALDLGSYEAPNVSADHIDSAVSRQGPEVLDCTGVPDHALDNGYTNKTPVYDSGWTRRAGFNIRVRWYGVPDDGKRRRWVNRLLFGNV